MWDDIYTLYNYGPFYPSELDGFGEIMCKSLNEFISENKNMIIDLSQEFSIEKPNNTKISSEKKKLKNKIFVITGNLNHYKNRDELVSIIEEFGGEVGWSVSTKTNYLINNDAQSNSSKNKNAHILGVPIINENEFIQMITS